MKTVMKKMFSLLLVAVLLVGVMPFQAFADGCTAAADCSASTHAAGCPKACTGGPDCTHVGVLHQPDCPKIPCSNSDNCGHTGDQHIAGCPKIACSNSVNCGHTGNQHVATCPKTCTGQADCPHTGVHHKADCLNIPCDRTENCPHKSVYHHADCLNIPCNKTANCPHKGVNHDSSCPKTCDGSVNCPHTGVHHVVTCASIPCDKTANCPHKSVYHDPNCLVVNPNAGSGDSGNTDSGNTDSGNTDSGNTGTGNSGSGNSGSGNSGSGNSGSNIPSGSHSLKVYARIWVHETKYETRLLDTITGLSSDAKIYQVIAANKDHLKAILPYDEFKALHWGETVNYLNDDKEYKDVGTRMTVGDENEVYVNLYSAEQLIVVNVHTSKTWAYDISVRIEGFRPGDLVTYEDVLKAVKKYYNVSSMKMFTYEEMCDYLDGGKADQIENFIAGEKDDPYEVFISGSRKSGAYKYTADSTNPKTGDEIFVPMAVLGLSASALAVMFYLNKKRAY